MSSRSPITRHQVILRALAFVGATLLVAVGLLAWRASRQRTARCADNLYVIYDALAEYQQQAGTLPELAFFPDDAQLDPDSLYTELAPFGIQPSHCLCPSAPETLRETGMTYIWNIALNGIPTADLAEPTWMLVEVHAMSASVRPPHQGAYNLLYSDGTVRSSRVAPSMP
jgi:hypothetical protein